MKNIIAIALVALLLSSCAKEEQPIQGNEYTLELTVNNQSDYPATFTIGYGLDSRGQQYESIMLPNVVFPVGTSTQTFVANCDYSNIYFCLMLIDRTKQNVLIDDFYGYGLTYVMMSMHDNTSMFIINK